MILNDLSRDSKRNDSIKLANYIQQSMITTLNNESNYKRIDLGVKQALFYVLFGARMPSVLVEVSFISFGDIQEKGIPNDVDVIINAGKVGTAWSGGEHWKNEKIIETITKWVADGGGFIGVGEPSALQYSSQYFQLSHLMGVDREIGLTMNNVKLEFAVSREKHFILEDTEGDIDFGKDIDNVFVLGKDTTVLSGKNGFPKITVNSFGKGHTIYLSGFKFSPENTRLLHRGLYWAAGRQNDFGPWTCSNIRTDCAFYPNTKKLVVISSSDKAEKTKVFGADGKSLDVSLEPYGIKIFDL